MHIFCQLQKYYLLPIKCTRKLKVPSRLSFQKIFFSSLSTILIFLYYDIAFYFTERNLFGDIEKLLNLLEVMGQRTSQLVTNGKRTTVKMLPGFVFLCRGLVPDLLGWAYPDQLGLSSTACGLVLGDSIRPCTNGVSLLHRIASVAPLSKPSTMFQQRALYIGHHMEHEI